MNQDEEWLLNEKYLGERTEEFFADCEQLEKGEPLAYVIGHIPFCNTTIYLDSKPLIPRTETEYWVEKVIDGILTNPQRSGAPLRVLDLCAGSGCIGVAVLHAIPNTTVDFVEIDTNLHATILKNITHNAIDETRTHIYGGDLFETLSGTYDYILTNPPYIDKVAHTTDTSVLEHEPHQALFGGAHGMEYITHIVRDASAFLTPSGTLVIEHEPEQVAAIRDLAGQHGFKAETYSDQYQVLRYTFLTRLLT